MANSRDRGFNTVQNSRIVRRQKTDNLQKYTLIGVLAMAALTVAVLVVMAVGAILQNANIGGGRDNERVDWGTFTVTATDTLYGDLVLVNNAHAYTFPASGEYLSEIYNTFATHSPRKYVQSGISTYMDIDALKALDAMLVAFCDATGKDNVQIRDAYRTMEDQAGHDILPGHSDHHTGLGCALKYVVNNGTRDVAYALATDETYNWLFENCYKYGFIIRYPEDKAAITGVSEYDYYFRYVGVAHATYMTKNNLCMEEYVEKLKEYDNENPLGIRGADGKYYEVYYVAVDGSATVKHPTNYAYTVSGTNEGGVIITVDRSKALSNEADTTADTNAAN